MSEKCLFDYAVVRLVPRVEREEFINVGVLLSCPAQAFLQVRFEINPKRLAALAPTLEISQIREHLEAIEKICEGGSSAGPIGELPSRSRFYWLTAPRSTIIQMSPIHTGLCAEPDRAIDRLFKAMVQTIENE